MATPSDAVLKVCQIAYYLYVPGREQKGDDWSVLKVKLLGDMQLLNGLKNFDITEVKPDMSKKAKAAIRQLKASLNNVEGDQLRTELKKKSLAGAGLFQWAASTDEYYDIFRMVEPKKKLAESMQKAKDEAEAQLAVTLAALQEVTEQLKQLNAEQKKKQDELDVLLKR